MHRPLIPVLLSICLSTGCATTKLLRLENELLKSQNTDLRQELEACEREAPPSDYATRVTAAVIVDYLKRAGFPDAEAGPGGVLTLPVQGKATDFRLSLQLFEREKVLYVAVSDYLLIEEATTSPAVVLLLTQLAALNYELLLGKFQLNPRSGAITFSVELNLDDGLGFRTFAAATQHLVRTADERYPELLRAAQGRGL